jgi:hypothetical protein
MRTACHSFILSFIFSPLFALAGEVITFYEVPLVCHADKAIGCGSRSKPALLQLENSSEIKEAWMNHEGTTFALVWANTELATQQQLAIIKPVFDKHKINFEPLNDDHRRKEHLTTFRAKGVWYKGANVDRLSMKEAETIAEKSVIRLVEEKLINLQEAKTIKADVESYFKKELVKLRTLDELRRDEMEFQEYVLSVYEKHLGKDRTEQIMEKFSEVKEMNKSKSKSCSPAGKGAKKSCCSSS